MSQIKNKFLSPMPTLTLKGNNTGGSANPQDLTVAQVNTMLGDVLANGTVAMTASLNMGSNQIANVTDPTAAQMAATKNYVDTAVAALQPQTSVYAATTGSNITGTYSNGVAGVGATFTTTSTATFTLDGTTPPLLSRILIKDQSTGFQNGIYMFTTAPVASVSGAVFTRTLDYDDAADMNSAGLIPVINGTLNALSSWQQVVTITTVGVDALVFTEFTANPSLYLLKANNLSDVASKSTSFNNLSPMTTGGDLIYGGASGTGTRLANGSAGQVLTSAGTTLAPTWSTPAATPTLTSLGIRSGQATLASGIATKSVTFSTSLGTSAYAVTATMANVTDSNPQIQSLIVTAQSATGFTVVWSDNTQTSNNVLNWTAIVNN